MTTETRNCQNCKAPFAIEPEDFAFYENMQVPPPTWCPHCRLQRRMVFMGNRTLYKRACDLCKKSVVSMYPAESKLTVYCNNCWWSDQWDATQYARAYDPSRPFLAQVKELNEATPQMALCVSYPTLVNSDYVNNAATAKNCYLIFFADECENVLYSEVLLHNKDSMDGTMFGYSELCYGLIVSGKCFRAFFCEDSENCHNIAFCKDCAGCSDCFGCIGLRNKRYHIWNQSYSKEEYDKKLAEFRVDSYEHLVALKERARVFWLTFPYRYAHSLRNMNVTGEYVYESKNSKDLFDVVHGAENSRYCQIMTMPGVKDSYDYTAWGNGAERCYEVATAGEGASNVKFSSQAWPNVRDIEYSLVAMSSSSIFGCANIRNKHYCILNKEYEKGEYEALRAKIIDDMNERPYKDAMGRKYPYGEFFPPEFSLFSYNESYVLDFIPLNQTEAEKHGFKWREAQPKAYSVTIKAGDIPDSILDMKDSILSEIIECADCKGPFRIIQAELDLLRRFGLPAPRNCPNCRYAERWKRVNLPGLHQGKCQCVGQGSTNGVHENTAPHFHGESACLNEFETPYAPGRPEIIYCEQCYNAEVV